MGDAETPTKPNPRNTKSGIYPARDALRQWGTRALDQRTRQAKDIQRFKASMIDDLGGPEAITTAQATLIELAARDLVLLYGIDSWIFENPNLRVFNKSKRKTYPLITDRQRIADGLTRRLQALGLDKNIPQTMTLDAIEADYTVEE